MKHTLFTLLLLTAISTVTATEAWREIKAVNAPGAAFTDAAQIRFKAPANTQFTLTDWQGKKLGNFTSGKEGLLSLPRLGAGFYRLSAPGMTGTRDFMVFMPGKRKDSFSEINTSMVWCTHLRPNGIPELPPSGPSVSLPLLQHGNFGLVREFVGWKEIWPEKNQFRWKKYVDTFRKIHEAGFKIVCCYHDSAYWARYKKGPGDKTLIPGYFPDDLIACYQFSKHLCKNLGPYVGMWEFWNEADGGFGEDTAWNYASCTKAGYLGFKAGTPEIPVLLGGMCVNPAYLYSATALKNDLEYYFDSYNYHTYRTMSSYAENMTQINEMLAKTGNAEKAVVYTETGTNSEGLTHVPSFRKGRMAHTFAQEMIVAEFHPKSILRLKMLGVSQVYPFILVPFNELNGCKDWGLLRQDFTVKPSFATLAVMNRVLGGSTLQGKLNSGKNASAYLLNNGKTQIVAYWAHSGLDTQKNDALPKEKISPAAKITISVPNGKYRLIGPFGEESSATVKNGKLVLSADRFVRYAVGLKGLLPAKKAVIRQNKGAVPFNGDKTIVIKALNSKDLEILSARDCVEIKSGIQNIDQKLDIFNLSDLGKSGTVSYDCGGIKGSIPNVKIAPWGKTTLALKLPVPKKSGNIVFGGIFNGKKITRCVIPFVTGNELKSVLIPRTADPKAWRNNSSGKMKISRGSEPGSVQFDVDFTGVKNSWSAPVFTLRKPAENIAGAVGMSFDIKINSDPSQVRWPFAYISADKKYQQGYRIGKNAWHHVKIRFAGVRNLDVANSFEIALCCKKGNLSYSVRNIAFDYVDLEKTARKQPFIRAARSDVWRKSSSGKMTISSDKNPGEVRFDIDFTGAKNRWAAPGVPLLLPQEKLTGAVGMTFEIKLNSNPADARWPNIFFFGADKLNVRESFALPGKGWTKVVIPFSNLKMPEKVSIFQIGLSGRKENLSYSVRNIGFYFK